MERAIVLRLRKNANTALQLPPGMSEMEAQAHLIQAAWQLNAAVQRKHGSLPKIVSAPGIKL